MTEIRALTIKQPYVEAIANQQKRIETRSWWTRYRGPLVIHAASRDSCTVPEWPRGAIVCVCRLVDVVPIEAVDPSPEERSLGDYAPGRWAWILEDPHRFRRPIPFVGRQGLWFVPENIEREAHRLLGKRRKPRSALRY